MSKRFAFLLLVRTAFAANAALTLAAMASALLVTGSALVGMSAAGAVVGNIPAAISGGIGSAAGRAATAWTIVAAVCFVFYRGGTATQVVATTALGTRIDAMLQRRLMDTVMSPHDIQHLEDPGIQNLVNVGAATFRAGWARPGRVASTAGGMLTAYMSLVASCVILARFNALFGLALAVSGIWVAYEDKRASRVEAAHHYGSSEGARRTEYLYELGVSPPAAKEVRVFGLSGFLRRRYGAIWQRSMADVFAPAGRRPVLASILFGLTALTGIVLVGRSALDGRLGLGAASAYVQIVMLVPLAAQQASWTGLQTELGLATLERYGEAVQAVRTAAPVYRPATGLPAADRPRSEIRFEDVTLTYSKATTPALRGLTLSIPAGRSVAIVGANGAGKSTLIKLLCRLYEPTEGRITVDGTDLRSLDVSSWRARIAAVFQDPTRFPVSARNNVEYGHLAAQGDNDAVMAAASAAGIRDVIESLPRGWDTTLSPQYSGGTDLSGGEWQKVALARALFAVKHGARVLILDEPAAHLDARSEADLYERFLLLTRGLTTVVISHRFSTVRRASSIVVMSGGSVVEQGSHDELMARGGEYAMMFNQQAARFADPVTRDPAG